jgi:hypothetical protein
MRNQGQNTRSAVRPETRIVVERWWIDQVERNLLLFFLHEEDTDHVYPGTFIYSGKYSVP